MIASFQLRVEFQESERTGLEGGRESSSQKIHNVVDDDFDF